MPLGVLKELRAPGSPAARHFLCSWEKAIKRMEQNGGFYEFLDVSISLTDERTLFLIRDQ